MHFILQNIKSFCVVLKIDKKKFINQRLKLTSNLDGFCIWQKD